MTDFDHFVGTQPVADKHSFDTAALSLWLQRHLPGFEGPLTVASFKGGQSNPTYKLQTPSRIYVMRAKPGPVAKLLPSAHAIEREFAVMRGLAGTEVPVPTMYCLCEDESVIGRAFYIMDFIEGRILWDQALPGMSKEERAAIYAEMNRVIAALHRVDVGAVDIGVPDCLRINHQYRTFIAAVQAAGLIDAGLAFARESQRLDLFLGVVAQILGAVVVAAIGAGFALVAAEKHVVFEVAHRECRDGSVDAKRGRKTARQGL